MSQPYYRPTFIQVNLQAIKSNIKRLKEKLPKHTSIMAVVKANGYGHGAIETAKAALQAGATQLAVASPEEAVQLRDAGITADILVLGASPISFLSIASERNITLTAYSFEWLFATREFTKPFKTHIKIDSGMGRIGIVQEEELQKAIAFIRERNWIEVTGVFTHFSTADEEDENHLKKQILSFERMLQLFEQRPAIVHTSNSAATLRNPSQHYDGVRFGISMYGIAPSNWIDENLPFPLERALSLHTEIVHVKKVKKGATIGYGAAYTAKTDEWIATLPIGYADGFLRKLHNQFVLVKGKRMPIVGKICMDQCMIRLDEQVDIGEKVVLLGKQMNEEIRIEEWANALQTIPYEICCTFSNRLPRLYSE
ncbi:alanine racemase [Psychrobacillus sp. OK032]|uniref:alanine racemase n=1 Tax=Psychrobacillus sp. OK032 TaxID=1884358 RepID=UPI0008C8F364|nr:alanine racemase [Psychrobacillus sp. OK032]SES28471.1 alanine racemase [Psychrobacillus sp. OK032]